MGSLVFEVERGMAHDVPNMVHRLLNLVDAAVVMSDNDDTAILAYFCISQSVTNKRLDCLECLSHLGDPSISALVSQAYRARKETWGTQMAAVMRLLPILGVGRCSKETFTLQVMFSSHNTMIYRESVLVQRHTRLKIWRWQLLIHA